MDDKSPLTYNASQPPPAYSVGQGVAQPPSAPPGPYQGGHAPAPSVGYQQPSQGGYTQYGHQRPTGNMYQAPPRDYMPLAAIACCFCWPMALCALMKSWQSQEALRMGHLEQATSNGLIARNLAIAAIAIGCVLVIIAVAVSAA